MKYRGLLPTYAEMMIRFHAQAFVYGNVVGMRAFSDPGRGTLDEKVSRALEELLSGQLTVGAIDGPPGRADALDARPAALPEEQRKGPGRPPTKPQGPQGPNQRQEGRP